MTRTEHIPVMREQAVTALAVRPAGVYVDCTFGRGGHSAPILARLGRAGRLFVFDKDPEAIAVARKMFRHDTRVVVTRGSYTLLKDIAGEYRLTGKVGGVLMDLGVSSPQLAGDCGFSFRNGGRLDMRMDPSSGLSAGDWLNRAGGDEIAGVLGELGGERYARRIARAILRYREDKEIRSAPELAGIVRGAVSTRERNKDPATRSFLGIRLFINNELEDLRSLLDGIHEILGPRGRIAVISFHSLEDRIVKRFLVRESRGVAYPRDIPIRGEGGGRRFKIIGRALKPTPAEVSANPRARSAIMRVGEKLAA